jgi:hypothetical protein
MLEFIIGFVIGGVVFACAAKLDSHRVTVKRRVKLETERELLRIQVDAASDTIQRIIHEEKA